MAYVKQTWEDLPSTQTPITASRLNHMEDGIAEAWEHGGGGGAGESLPIGSEIEFDGLATDIPTGWEQIDGNVFSEYVLYDSDTGTTDTVTLSDSSANYDYIEIFFTDNNSAYTSVKVPNADGKYASLTCYWVGANSNALYVNSKIVSISGTSITVYRYIQASFEGSWSKSAVNNIKIYKVVGYK